MGERHGRLGGLGRQGQDRRGKAGRCKAEAEQRGTGTRQNTVGARTDVGAVTDVDTRVGIVRKRAH